MKVKLTLMRPNQTSVDLAITTEPTTTIGDIALELSRADPTVQATGQPTSSTTLRLHERDAAGAQRTRVLDHAAQLSDSGLASGAEVSLAPASEYGSKRQSAAGTVRVVSGPN